MARIHYLGKSMLDGNPILSAFSGFESMTRNKKTGDVIQQWIMRSDVDPVTALKTGADESICGQCPLRGVNGKERTCYVLVFQAPRAVYNDCMNQIDKPLMKLDNLEGRVVRLGAYGDPAALPLGETIKIAGKAKAVIGYTHQWRTCDKGFQYYVMASVTSAQEREEARAMGWATFRAKHADEPVLPGEFPCPASVEAGSVMNCRECRRCGGAGNRDVVINVHGRNKYLLPRGAV